MNCEEVREDLEAYSLRALDAVAVARVEAHLPGCRACSEIVRAYRYAVDYLALGVPVYRAPGRLKERVMGGIGAARTLTMPRILAEHRWLQAVAGMALVAIAVGAIAWAVVLSARVNDLTEDNQQLAALTELDAGQRAALLKLQQDMNSARSQQQQLSTTLQDQATLLVIALDPELVPTALEGTEIAPSASCGYVWSKQQSLGALTCKGLPAISFSLTYELWALKGDKLVQVASVVPQTDGSAQILVRFPADAPGLITDMWVTLETGRNQTRAKPSDQVILRKAPVEEAAR